MQHHHSDRGKAIPVDPLHRPAPSRRRRPLRRGKGDSYDEAAESLIGLYKTELIRRRVPWKGLDDVERATLGYVDWFNHQRLHGHCGDIPPVKFEDQHYRSIAALNSEDAA